MKKLVSILLVLAMLFTFAACGGEKEEAKEYTTYVELYSSELSTHDWTNSTTTALTSFQSYCCANLITTDRYSLVRPLIADQWTISDNGAKYTFYLGKDNWWVDKTGKKTEQIKAANFVDAAKWILDTDRSNSSVANTIYNNIKGAKEYFDARAAWVAAGKTGTAPSFDKVGMKALDDYTLEYTLVGPCPYFLGMMGNNVWSPVPSEFLAAHEATYGTDADNLLYSGPYYCTEIEVEYQKTCERNPLYRYADWVSVGTIVLRYNKEATANGAELFLRGDSGYVSLSNDIAREWMKDPEKKAQMHPEALNNMTYWIMFNYNPRYDAKNDPDSWRIAVNNVNFRTSIFYAFDGWSYNQMRDEWGYKKDCALTFTRTGLANVGADDYTKIEGLNEYSDRERNYDPERAKKAAAVAKEELVAAGAKLPIKIVMVYNSTSEATGNRYLALKQAWEELLGKDYIEVVVEPYSGSGFNADVRNAGTWSMLDIGWGPDYKDVISQFDPVMSNALAANWGSFHLATEYYIEELGYGDIEKLAREADAEKVDLDKRNRTFAKAEKLMLDRAMIIPAYRGGGGYEADICEPFSRRCGAMGDEGRRTTAVFAITHEKSASEEEYYTYQEAYIKARDEARGKYAEEEKAYVK